MSAPRQEYCACESGYSGKRQQQLKANSVLAPKFGFSYRSDILAPAKYLFNALAHPLADVITAMSGSACIDGRTSVGVILCHMRGRPELAKFHNKAFGVVKLVATDRNPAVCPGVRPAYQRRCPAPPCRWPRSDHHPPPAHGGSPSAHDPYSRIGPPCHDLCDTAWTQDQCSIHAYRSCAFARGNPAPDYAHLLQAGHPTRSFARTLFSDARSRSVAVPSP